MSILTDAPEGAKVLDLGAARVARAEARAASGEGNPFIRLAAGYVEVKPEVDLESATDFMSGNLRGGLAKLLADHDDVDALMAGGISKADLDEIMQFVTGKPLGESLALSQP